MIKDINILFKTLCMLLAYNVKCEVIDRGVKIIGTLNGYTPLTDGSKLFGLSNKEYDAPDKYWQPKAQFSVEEIKPYLRPMSSMTDEEKEELKQEFCIDVREEDNGRHTEEYGYVTVYHNFNNETWYIPYEAIDWLNEHHFDYRGLIEKGLAMKY